MNDTSTLESTDHDKSNEVAVLSAVQEYFPLLHAANLEPTFDATDSYDFTGSATVSVEVKVSSYASTAFPEYFVTAKKVQTAQQHPERMYFILIYFQADKHTCVYYLNPKHCRKGKLSFTHPRTKNEVVLEGYYLPRHLKIAEYSGQILF